MSYNNANKRINVEGIDITAGTTFNINCSNFIPYNGCWYSMTLCQCLNQTEATGTEPVTITLDGTEYPVLDEIGNNLVSGRLDGFKRYRLRYGNDDPHFLLYGCRCCIRYKAPEEA